MAKSTKTNDNGLLNYLVDYYEQFNSLPTPVIECTVSGTAYTAFGSNLKNKVEKAGGIRELLTTFVGRGVKKKENVKATITPRKKSTKKVVHISANDLESSRVSLTNEDVIKDAFLVASVTPNE